VAIYLALTRPDRREGADATHFDPLWKRERGIQLEQINLFYGYWHLAAPSTVGIPRWWEATAAEGCAAAQT
jgi:hypothetical protein